MKGEFDAASLVEENRQLKQALALQKIDIDKLKANPLLVCAVREVINEKGIIRMHNGNNFYVDILNEAKGKVKKGDTALVEQNSLAIIGKLSCTKNFDAENFVIVEKPAVTWKHIGGMKEEINEIKEVIELPLKKPSLFKKVGITPPKGILLYGSPGCGKTLLAKAVANSSDTTFIEIVGSELVQKFIGEGAKLVKDIFKMAREKAPSIVFIDELDAIAAKRVDIGISGEREVERTFMQLLAEIDGFDNLGDVKVIGATNRIDILDHAILRPGRLDRLIEVKHPDEKSRKEIFRIYLRDMNLLGVSLNELARLTEGCSGAEIRAICTEAGYFAIRNSRTDVNNEDFALSIRKVRAEEEDNSHFLKMYG